ncbi:MAG: MBOAT family O-acyltransferase [Clostridium sp.]
MLISIVFNYGFGLMVVKGKEDKRAKTYLIMSVVFNIGLLGVFKYTGFIMDNVNSFFGLNIPYPHLTLPLGISFFTFQALSYVIDVYRNDAKVQKSVFDLALYITLFPQLVAGPIVRYQSVADQMESRSHTVEKFGEGVKRFMQGMGKKVLIANPLGSVADTVFVIPPDEISVATSWIAIIAYSLQIYFDFSGYSDMAIGLGKMFGFDFLENFNYPYISQSVSEFWRRWHISLGSWFREYVYIPLGGNRVGPIRVYFNLFVVWMLTGFWHGAAWNFVAWGLYFGVLIALEKAFLGKVLNKVYRPIRHMYLILAVIVGWVFFRAESFTQGIDYLKSMLGLAGNQLYDGLAYVSISDYGYLMVIGIILSTPILKVIIEKIKGKNPRLLENSFMYFSKSMVYSVMFLVIIVKLVNSTYNPFLYFRF